MNESHHRLALPQGTRIQGFEFHRVLGQGGFGITYLGWNLALSIPVAIKEYLPSDLATRESDLSVVPQSSQAASNFAWGLDRFLDEARTLARFDHRHIIKVYHFFEAHGTAYIVMEYAEGETLSKFLQSRGTLNEDELEAILYPILEGLKVVHGSDFLHRDIKPGNIIIRAEDHSPVLLDFGAARQAIGTKSRSVTSIVTPGYAPIEQYERSGHQGPWTDIYALGAVCYHALTGQVPNDATERVRRDALISVSERCAGQASAGFLSAIDSALQVNEEDRPQSIADWRVTLEPPPPPPPLPPEDEEREEIGSDDDTDGKDDKDSKCNLPESTEPASHLNKWFIGFCISLLVIPFSFITLPDALFFSATYLPFVIINLLCGGYILHKLWRLIPAKEAKTTPGKMVGFLFIPIFNLYWNFIAIYGLAQALNSQTRRHEIKNKKVSKGLCLIFCIFFTFNFLIFHLLVLSLCGVDDALLEALLPFFIFFTTPANIVLGIITFKQLKNTGIHIIE